MSSKESPANKGETKKYNFVKGKSGNPSGRPKETITLDDGTTINLREMARARTKDAFEVLLKCMASSDERVASSAAESILSRGWGKAPQVVTGEDGEGAVKLDHLINVQFVSAVKR